MTEALPKPPASTGLSSTPTGNPLVSTVVPTYNRAALLRAALASVAAQDYRPIEVIVVDDASTDDTGNVLEAARAMFDQEGIAFTPQMLPEHIGTGAARNTGVELSAGTLVAFLDSDDLWEPSYASTAVNLLRSFPECGLAFCGIRGIYEDGTPFGVRDSGLPNEQTVGCLRKPFEAIVRQMPLQTSGVVVRRDVLERVGMFDEAVEIGQDWDLWYRIGMRFDFAYTRTPLVRQRHHRGNVPKWSTKGLAWEIRIGLRYVGDVEDQPTRAILIQRIQTAQTLLQEQLMRDELAIDDYQVLLYNELSPRSHRFRLGHRVLHGSPWLRKPYASAVRTAGSAHRRLVALSHTRLRRSTGHSRGCS